MSPRPAASRRPLPASPFNVPQPAAVVEQFAVDDRVSHDQFGLGTVVGLEGGGHAVLVDFGPQKVRITTPFSKLHKL